MAGDGEHEDQAADAPDAGPHLREAADRLLL